MKSKETSFTNQEFQDIMKVINQKKSNKATAYKITEYVDCKKIIDVINNRRDYHYDIKGLKSDYQEAYSRIENLYDNGFFEVEIYQKNGVHKLKMNIQELKKRIEAINILYNKICLNACDYELIYNIYLYFQNYEEFKKAYIHITNTNNSEIEEISCAKDALNNIDMIYSRCDQAFANQDKCEKAINDARREKNNRENNYYQLYPTAKNILNQYMKLIKNSISIYYPDELEIPEEKLENYIKTIKRLFNNDIKDVIGISNNEFNNCLLVVKNVNPKLHEEYQNMLDLYQLRLKQYYFNIFDYIVYQIQYNREYNFIDFLSDLPINDFNSNWRVNLKKQLIKLNYNSDNANIINDYININRLASATPISRVLTVKNGQCSFNGELYGEDEINAIFDFMEANDIKPLDIIYKDYRRQYMDHLLDISEYINKRKLNKTLI